MIDIHCHILPGLDDGAQDYEDSLRMADQAIDNGITDIIATPHHQTRRFFNEASSVEVAVQELNHYLQSHGRNLTIHPGQEIRIYGEITEELDSGLNMALQSRLNPYVLVEFPSSQVPVFAERTIYDLQVAGYRPIIAHPERNSAITEDPDKLYRLVNQGALTQLTAASVAGEFNKKVQRFSLDCIEANMAHFIASDAHNTDHRGFSLAKAYNKVEKVFGTAEPFIQNAVSLLKGHTIVASPPSEMRSKGFLQKLLSI
ncbi:tyrosine protein phosphatase [Jeotgalibacillus malaysiensis]|uniref:Tyrosine-protein phosphatase n=1 Tax=Jeotgalibacillus malaysiensis TaxID=1508404 RepID=A0A0B5AW60_9BACL|nr:CpsB/CapC family capsule biosynthesis tyrosine phosphatase [Jeotgalibacillus malaysiensis]AJD92264.1 tyrosine protein phosphatase [Jeotgalibacillus malaysiensis]